MRVDTIIQRFLLLAVSMCLAFGVPVAHAQAAPNSQAKILMPEDLTRIMPGMVFFRGQSASVQMRNAYGVQFPGGTMLLAALVDNSGYSSGIKQKYQGYLLSENTLTVNGRTLQAGAYGFGFLANNQFVVMNLGAMDVLSVPDQMDAAMSRPRPLSITAGKHAGSYRLYEGKNFVSIRLK